METNNSIISKKWLLFCILFIAAACTQVKEPISSEHLPRSNPETEGVSSEGILQFIDALEKSEHEPHSFMLLRHGKVIAEGWWDPYRADLKHSMYSTSKSFTSTAVGFAVNERLLSVTDKVISFFPDDLPDVIEPYLEELTVKDILTMSVGQDPDPTVKIIYNETNWVKGFLGLPIVHQPGTTFLYNTLATYIASAIVQKATGEKVIDYLTPRLFDPLNIQGIDWEVDPRGINTGGWGLRLKTEDMAKFGQLYLQKGFWNEISILPETWIHEATSAQIYQSPDMPQEEKDKNDWVQGYGYQFWRSRNNAFRADGAFGQYIIVLPEKDAVVILTSESPNMQGEIDIVWDKLLPAIKDNALPVNVEQAAALKNKLANLALPISPKNEHPAISKEISGKTYYLESNEGNIETLNFFFNDSSCQLILNDSSGEYKYSFGSGTWDIGKTTKPGPSLLGDAKASYAGLPPLEVGGNYSWQDDTTLILTLRYIESPHTLTWKCHFDDKTLTMAYQISFAPGRAFPKLRGIMKE